MDANGLHLQIFNAIRNAGVRDPNVDLFIGVLESRPEQVEQAIADGADVNKTDGEVIHYHRVLLFKHCPEKLREWSLGREAEQSTIM